MKEVKSLFVFVFSLTLFCVIFFHRKEEDTTIQKSSMTFPLFSERKEIVEKMPDIFLEKDTILQGSVLYFELKGESVHRVKSIKFHDSQMPFISVDSSFAIGLLACDVRRSTGVDSFFIETKGGNIFSYKIFIDTLDAGVRDMGKSTSDTAILNYNKAVLRDSKKDSPKSFFFNEPFLEDMLSSYVTSPFGRTRIYHITSASGKDSSFTKRHLGKDVRVRVGTPVVSPNDGVVILTEELGAGWGKTMVVDFGRNVFVVYMHLSEFSFTQDDIVLKGDTIAFTGYSGLKRKEDAHLHLLFHFSDEVVDPFISIEKLNFLLKKMEEYKVGK